jgi:glycosyltransferase involved in cell wall biosynthesis
MRILFLTQVVPYPPDAGPKVKTWQVLRYLHARGHRVTLVSFVRPEEEAGLLVLHELCEAVHGVPIRRSRLRDAGYWLKAQLSGRPFLVERDDLVGMRHLVGELLVGGTFDAVHADQITMAQFAMDPIGGRGNARKTAKRGMTPHKPRLRDCLEVFDAHNAVWTILERMEANAPPPLRPLLAQETRRVKYHEGLIVNRFDHTLAVSETDRRALLESSRAAAFGGDGSGDRSPGEGRPSIRVIPIAIDTDRLAPVERMPLGMDVFTMGSMHYPPNADGIRWFAREVFPRVREALPSASLTIAGRKPPKDLVDWASDNSRGLRIEGYVPDLVPFLARAAVVVVPVRAGGGMRVRILEAFSRGVPVITTTVGLEGIEAVPGRDVLVADDPSGFAEALIRLLQDRALQAQLAEAGRRLAVERYDWRVALRALDTIYPAKPS